ncbi:MAG: enoyl-CoA hydratase/isomerase family protein [Dehalococcoidia bacterium]
MSTIRYEQRGRVGWLWLDRPNRLNAQNAQMAGEIISLLDTLVEENATGALVVIGVGDSFSTGLDLDEAGSTMTGDHVARLAGVPFPTVAAIRGFALGGGLELALACDVRVAAEGATLGLPEVSLGILPGWGGTQRLPRIAGPAFASELILTADPVSAERAAAAGLVNRLVPGDRLEAEAGALAETMARLAPIASQYAKEAIHSGLDLPLPHALELEGDLYVLLESTADRLEGIDAFRQKRPPVWRGR